MSDDLRTRLEQLRDSLAPRGDEATLAGVQRRHRQRRQRQRFGTGALALLVTVGATGFLIRAFSSSPTTPVAPPVVAPEIGRSTKVGPQGGTSDMVAGFGKLWVTVSGVPGGEGTQQDALVEVDPQTLEITRTLGVPTVPTWEVGGGGLLATNDAIWIAGSTLGDTGDVATLVRVDPASGETTTSTWAGADRFVDVATDGTSLWVLAQQGPHPVVTRFDPTTGTFSGDVKLSGDEGRHIVAVPGAVIVSQFTWQGGSGPCLSLASVNPSTNPTLRAEFPASPCGEENTVGLSPFVIGSDIWTAYKGITFTTVDPETAAPRPVDPPPYPPVSPRSDPVASDSGVWFGDYPGGNGSQPDILTRFDPTTNTVEPTDVRIGWSVAVPGDGMLWAMGWDGSLTEIVLTAAPSATSGTASASSAPPSAQPFPAESLDRPIIASLNYRLAQVARSTTTPRWLTGTDTSLRTPFPVRDIAISSDGSMVAFTGFSSIEGTSYLYVGPTDGSRWTPLLSAAGGEHPSWSPDGSRLTFFSGSSIYIVDADGTGLEQVVNGRDPSWSPDGRTIAYVRPGGGISLLDITSRTSTELTNSDDEWPAFAPDGSDVAFVRTDTSGSNVLFVPTAGGDPVSLTDCAPCGTQSWPIWSPSGSSVAFVVDGDIVEVSTSGEEIAHVSFNDAFGHSLGNFVWLPPSASG